MNKIEQQIERLEQIAKEKAAIHCNRENPMLFSEGDGHRKEDYDSWDYAQSLRLLNDVANAAERSLDAGFPSVVIEDRRLRKALAAWKEHSDE